MPNDPQFEKVEPPLTGSALEHAVFEEHQEHIPIVNDFIYENAVVMLVGDPGAGKSSTALQIATEIASGHSVFGYLTVPKPRVVYYIPFERTIIESLDRIKTFSESMVINFDNLWIDGSLTTVDVEERAERRGIINRIKAHCKPDIVFLDPIYACVSGELSQERPAKAINMLSKQLQREFGCAVWLNHHTSKDTYNHKGEKIIKDDPSYGSRWFKAHITMQYNMETDKDGSLWTKKKDNWGVGIDMLKLNYRQDTQLSFVDQTNASSLPTVERVKTYLKSCKTFGKCPTFKDICDQITGVTSRTLRRIISEQLLDNIEKHKSIGNSTLYSWKE